MSVLFTVLMYGLWSSVFAFAKVALAYSPPLFLTGFRMVLGGVLLSIYLILFKRKDLRCSGKQFFSIALLAFFSIYLTNILEFWALQYLTASKACFIYSLSPFFAAFFSYLHFGELMTPKKWLGLMIGFLGILPVVFTQVGAEEHFTLGALFSLPTLAVMGAALASVYGWVLLRLVVRGDGVSPVTANGYSMLLGGALALGHSFFVEGWHPTPVTEWSPFLVATGGITLISNVICFNLYGWMLKRFTATFLSFVGLISPLFASLHGFLFLGEPISWVILLSTAIVSVGLWIVYAAELRQGYIYTGSR